MQTWICLNCPKTTIRSHVEMTIHLKENHGIDLIVNPPPYDRNRHWVNRDPFESRWEWGIGDVTWQTRFGD